jgi:hypothetical protein
MFGLLRTLFFIGIIYYLIRFINRVLMPYFRAVTEINERQKSNVIYRGNPSKSEPSNRPDGDYVDYKEID